MRDRTVPARTFPECRDAAHRVTLVSASLGGGGAERVISGLTRYWAGAGHAVSVVTMASRETDVYALDARVQRIALGLVRPSRNLPEGLVRAGARVRALRRTLLELRPDTAVSFIASTNVVTLLAAIGTRVPVVVCERTDPRHDPNFSHRSAWGVLRRMLYPRAAAVVVQTESVAAWARTFCRRVHVIPNFVETPQRAATPGIDEGPKRLVALGRLSPEKGFDLLVEAFGRVAWAFPDWCLVIAGEGGERARLEALRAALHLEGRVWLPGRVEDPEQLLAGAHAFALSSTREGYPNALLEAMACGLPAAAFACPSGPAEIISDGVDGLLVPPRDVGRLSAALHRLMSSPQERARLGENARTIATRLAPARVLRAWDDLLRPGGTP